MKTHRRKKPWQKEESLMEKNPRNIYILSSKLYSLKISELRPSTGFIIIVIFHRKMVLFGIFVLSFCFFLCLVMVFYVHNYAIFLLLLFAVNVSVLFFFCSAACCHRPKLYMENK